jgi:hypothetical protein
VQRVRPSSSGPPKIVEAVAVEREGAVGLEVGADVEIVLGQRGVEASPEGGNASILADGSGDACVEGDAIGAAAAGVVGQQGSDDWGIGVEGWPRHYDRHRQLSLSRPWAGSCGP